MSSAARALANRQNSLHSTGSVTAAGKAASSRNAMCHGFTSKQIALPGEDAAQYDEQRQDLLATDVPAYAAEALLVEELAQPHGVCSEPDAGFATSFVERSEEKRAALELAAVEYRASSSITGFVSQ